MIIQADLVRGTHLLAKLAEDQSLSSIMNELSIDQDKECSQVEDDSAKSKMQLFMAFHNVERISLHDERERLRYWYNPN